MTNLEYPPLFKLYEIDIKPEKQAQYFALGKRNLNLSIKTEPQTLAMHATHSDKKGLKNLIFELYQNKAAQERHRNSPQFKKYALFAKNATTKRKVTELIPELLLEKYDFLSKSSSENMAVKYAHISLKRESAAAFKAAVFSEMQQAIALEEGVCAMYAATIQNQPDEWLFLEFYQDKAAYDKHRATPHFKEYLEKTKGLVETKDLTDLVADTLVSQGNLNYDWGN